MIEGNHFDTSMATLNIKNIPDEIVEHLKENAEKHHRSLNKEVIATLEGALTRRPKKSVEEILADAERFREITKGHNLKLSDFRKAREEDHE